jgi:nucleotide-binding universal stress UspA family protein
MTVHSPYRVLHPTDLGAGSRTAFLHAVRLAVAAGGTITVLHVHAQNSEGMPVELPPVRATLARWGFLQDERDLEGLTALGVGVRKLVSKGADPVTASLAHLEQHPADLVVLSTRQRNGRMAWLSGSVAEPLARGSGEPSLFIPEGCTGFVDPAKGTVNLRRVLIPVALDPAPRRALDAAAALAERLGVEEVAFTFLHVGTTDGQPLLDPPARAGWSYERIVRTGDVVEQVVHAADALRSDLVVMATKGHDGFLDALRGSTTERVLRLVKCPVLAVPA